MAIVTHDYIKRQIAEDPSLAMENFSYSHRMIKSLNESIQTKYYDIFLSHSYLDINEVAYLQKKLTSMGCSVFVDWDEYPDLDREQVTRDTVTIIRNTMKKCKSLIYAFSDNAYQSSWMPWELGFFDGFRGANENICIFPIADDRIDDEDYDGVEYISIYPFISLTKSEGGNLNYYVNYSSDEYEVFQKWIQRIQNKSLLRGV